jgi:hypothetical protein
MRSSSIFFTALLLASAAYAKDLKAYQDATLKQMDSVSCSSSAKDAYCQEYILETGQVQYRIRPANEKHPVLLPVGAPAQFRLEKAKLLLRIPTFDNKEREFAIISVKPQGDRSADATLVHLNHLQ